MGTSALIVALFLLIAVVAWCAALQHKLTQLEDKQQQLSDENHALTATLGHIPQKKYRYFLQDPEECAKALVVADIRDHLMQAAMKSFLDAAQSRSRANNFSGHRDYHLEDAERLEVQAWKYLNDYLAAPELPRTA